MNDTVILILVGAAGVVLGAFFFGGLWWTVRRGVVSSQPALWFLGSALLRTAITLAGFYFVAGGQWQRLVSCLVGFLAARIVVTLLSRPPAHSSDPVAANK
jgi:F1F0 ATPase subunit 2